MMHLVLLGLLLWASPSWAAITHDASSNSGVKANEQNTSSYSHTAGTITNGLAVCRIASQDSTPGTISGVTYNGAAMTQIGSTVTFATSSRSAISQWYYKNPPSGASAVVATFSEIMNSHIVMCSTYAGVDQTTPIDTANVNSATNFDTVDPSEAQVTVTSQVGYLVTGVCAFATATGAAATTDTERANVLNSTNTAAIGSDDTGAASTVLSCTLAESRNNGIHGASMIPATSTRRPIAPILFQ